ncbi:MAG TPA: hypothetical protein VJP88_01005 [Caulobacteraceae bacterium]|nr:hypothetical protein [Caulobacteraceae bacterium]
MRPLRTAASTAISSKDVLVSQACAAALEHTAGQWEELARNIGEDAAWESFVAACLAGDLGSPSNPACPAAILGVDVARRAHTLQASYVALIRQLIDRSPPRPGPSAVTPS